MTKDIKWMRELVKTCHSVYINFHWGKDYERMGAAAEELEIEFVSLVNFSETRFANSKWKVFNNIFVMLAAILSVLEEDVVRAAANRSGLFF